MIGSIKFTSTPHPKNEDYKVIPKDKTQAEFFISNLVAQQLIVGGNKIYKLEVNNDDSNKGSDILMAINNEEIGIQLTRFTLHNLIQRRETSRRREYELVELILKQVKIDFELNIHIIPNTISKTETPINKKNLKESLANEISLLINNNVEQLRKDKNWLTFDLQNENSKKIAQGVALEPLKFGWHSNFHGKNNIYIDFGFDNISLELDDLQKEVDNIFERKNGGKAEILIIWVEMYEVLYKTMELKNMLIKKFRNSSFRRVVLFTYLDRKDLFYASNGFNIIK